MILISGVVLTFLSQGVHRAHAGLYVLLRSTLSLPFLLGLLTVRSSRPPSLLTRSRSFVLTRVFAADTRNPFEICARKLISRVAILRPIKVGRRRSLTVAPPS